MQKRRKKVYSLSSLPELLKNVSEKKIVLAGGCFDILHYGHITFLENASNEGDVLIILLESDDFIKKFKKRTPVHTQDERAHILSQLESVDAVIKLPLFNMSSNYFDEKTGYFALIESISPHIIAVTEGDPRLDIKTKQAEMIGAQVKEVTKLLPFASSNILYETFFSD
jgi:cytidyltransferase-like protein